MHNESFIVYIKTEDIYADIVNDVETKFDTWIYALDRPLPKGKNEKCKWNKLMTNELGGKIVTEFAALRLKTYNLKHI